MRVALEILARDGFDEAFEFALEQDDAAQAMLVPALFEKVKRTDDLEVFADDLDEVKNPRLRFKLALAVLDHPACDEKMRSEVVDHLDTFSGLEERAALLAKALQHETGPGLEDLLEKVAELDPEDRSTFLLHAISRFSTPVLIDHDILDELNTLPDDGARYAVLLRMLTRDAALPDEYHHKLVRAARQIQDQQLLSRFLLASAERAQPSRDFFDSAEKLKSDALKTEVLLKTIEQKVVQAHTLEMVLSCAEEIKDDTGRARVLARSMEVAPPKAPIAVSVVSVIEDMDGESVNMELIHSLLKKQLGQEQLSFVIKKVPKMVDSDHNRGEILIQLAPHANLDSNFFGAIDSMDSEYQKSRVMLHLLDRDGLTEEELDWVLTTCRSFEKDESKFRVLAYLTKKHEITPSLEPVFEELLDSFKKQYYRKQIERAQDH